MTTIRMFIAIELPPPAIETVNRLQSRLKGVVPPHTVSWVSTRNMHLTLHFLGDVVRGDVESIKTAINQLAATQQPFPLIIGGLGCFPNLHRPRVVWLGLMEPTTPLQALHVQLGQQLQQTIGYQPEHRPYSPHLTLGRVKKGIPARHLKQLSQVLKQEHGKVGKLVDLDVAEIVLMQSDLKSTGSVYTPLARGQWR